MKTLSILALLCFSVPSSLADLAVRFDETVNDAVKKQVLDDFAFVQGVISTRTSPLHQEIFGPVNGANYLQWFSKRVFDFGVDVDADPATVAYHSNDSDLIHKIFVTNHYVSGGYPLVGRVMTLFHEARHTEQENRFWEHAICPKRFPYRSIWTGGSLGGGYACENNAYGSYSTVTVMMNNVSKFCANCSDKVKADAKLYSEDQILRVIDETAMAMLRADGAD